MRQVKSIIRINKGMFRKLEQAQITALEKTAEALHTEVVQEQVIPRDTGALQNESTFVDYTDAKYGKVQIVSSTPYARRLYYHPEYHFSTDENPNARGKWFEPWISGENKDFAKDCYREFYGKEIGQ